MRKTGTVTSLGKYQLLVELARGGMGIVHLAVVQGPAGFSKLVVIKELPPVLSNRPELVEMFLEEARIAARLNHPNIVQTNEVGSEGDQHFLAMEYLDGQSLRTVLKATERGPRLPLPVYLHILIEALAGLHHAHQLTDFSGKPLNVVHRDVSPHNLIVTYAGVTKVVDFGLARASDTLRNTGSGVLRGKLGYMAPEQVRGDVVDRRADIFSVGVMLWEALTARRMWRGLTELAVAHLLASGDIPHVRGTGVDVPEELARICDRALAPAPGERYATAREMQADLESYLSRQGRHATQRGVGTLLAELFLQDRERVRALIDAQLRELRRHGPRTPMLSFIDPEASTSVRHVVASGPASDPLDEDQSPTERFLHPRLGADPPAASVSSLTPLNGAPSAQFELFATPRGRLLGAAATVLFAGMAIGLAVGGAVRAPGARALAGEARQDGGKVKLAVRAAPPGAEIFLDDVKRGEGALELVLPRDGTTHDLRIEASGYAPQREQLVLRQDLEVRVALERLTPR